MKLVNYTFKNVISYALDLFAIIIWTLLFTKIFIFDVEKEVYEYFGISNQWIFYYRSIIYTVLLCLLWYGFGNKRFLLGLMYLIFYPFIVAFWKFPKIAFWMIPKKMYKSKSWAMLYSYLNFWMNLILSFRSNLFKLCLFLVALLILFKSSNQIALVICISIYAILLLMHLIDRFKVAFTPIRIFKINFQLHILKNKISDMYIDQIITSYQDSVENLQDNQDEIEKQKVQTLQQFVLTHQVVEFIKQRLLEFKKTRIYFAAFSLKIISTIVTCLILISLMNYALFNINHTSFTVTIPVNYFHFIYYTFHSIFLNAVDIITPHSGWAMFINMMAPNMGIIITVFLITLYWNVSGERYKEDIDELIAFSQVYIESVEDRLIASFNINMQDALIYLKANKSSLYGMFQNGDRKIQIEEEVGI